MTQVFVALSQRALESPPQMMSLPVPQASPGCFGATQVVVAAAQTVPCTQPSPGRVVGAHGAPAIAHAADAFLPHGGVSARGPQWPVPSHVRPRTQSR